MEIQEFTRILAAKQRELDTLMRRKLPVQVGNMAKTHYHKRTPGAAKNFDTPRKTIRFLNVFVKGTAVTSSITGANST